MGHGAAGLVTVPGETSLTPCKDPTGGVIKRAGGRDRGQTLSLLPLGLGAEKVSTHPERFRDSDSKGTPATDMMGGQSLSRQCFSFLVGT